MTDAPLLRTPLCDWHSAHGGRMVDFAGWLMPVQYTSIVEEHAATRNALTLFDVSHMGRLRFAGDGVAEFLDSVVTRHVSDMPVGKIRYALVCNESGGIRDDVLVYRLTGSDDPYFQIVCNASNREKIVGHLRAHATGRVEVHDFTTETAMIAVQGPRANEVVTRLTSVDPATLKYYTAVEAQIAGATGLLSRTGYTGEDGCELIVPAAAGVAVWEAVLREGEQAGARAAGLGARDTLRLESAMPLYGHELSETINPVEAGLGFALSLAGGRRFVGSDAIRRFVDDPKQRRRIGLTLDSKRVPRQGYAVVRDGQPVGEVTSGTFSPTLQRPIAMALVTPEAATTGAQLAIDIRGQVEPAKVVPLPFYQRK